MNTTRQPLPCLPAAQLTAARNNPAHAGERPAGTLLAGVPEPQLPQLRAALRGAAGNELGRAQVQAGGCDDRRRAGGGQQRGDSVPSGSGAARMT